MKPPYLFGDTNTSIISLTQDYHTTNEGIAEISLQVKRGYIGTWGITLSAGGVYTKILLLRTRDE
jgi:hypothetical protein